jgi:hypothetical protein
LAFLCFNRVIVKDLAERLNVATVHRDLMLDSPDALDAVVAVFAAIAVYKDRIAVPPPNETQEGWIAVHD